MQLVVRVAAAVPELIILISIFSIFIIIIYHIFRIKIIIQESYSVT